MKKNLQKRIVLSIAILACIGILALFIQPTSSTKHEVVTATEPQSKVDPIHPNASQNTIASAWQWEVMTDNNSDADTVEPNHSLNNATLSPLPFTQESIYTALQAVKLDEHGDVIIDNDALNALNSALDHSNVVLDDNALNALQNLIRKGLPGNAGEQTAQIVADFYQYLGAKKEFNSLYEDTNAETSTIEDYETQYTELLALRSLYLGDNVANQLYAEADANSRYMFDSMKVEANTELSDNEKQQLQADIVARHAESTIDVNNWNARYEAFNMEKKTIINASLSKDEKREQLKTLMQQHFSDDELTHVSHLPLDSL